MKNLISSKDNSIQPNGAIGKQKCGIIFWQKTGFLRHCNYLGFQSMITLISKKFSPSNIQNNGESCFFQFDNDDKKIIYLSLKKETNSKHYFIYGESHTVYADSKFHILALDVASYIGKQIGCKFFVDDATDFLEHQSIDKLDEYIDNFEIPSFESPDLLRQALKNKFSLASFLSTRAKNLLGRSSGRFLLFHFSLSTLHFSLNPSEKAFGR